MHKLFVRFTALLLILASVSPVFAATVTDPTLLEQRRQEQQQREQELRERLQPPSPPEQPRPERGPVTLLPGKSCQNIQKIFLYGADHLPKKSRRTLARRFLSQCLTNDGIASLIDAYQEAYLQAGYTTTRVGLKSPQSSFDRGNLELWVVEGRINRIILNEDTAFDRSRVDAAFPIGTGDVLNIHALDQGMEQLGRLFSQRFRMQIVPAEQAGFSDIKLIEYYENDTSLAKDGSRFKTGRERMIYSYNNGGTDATGSGLGQAKYTRENLWGKNDSLSFSGQLSAPIEFGRRENQVWQLSGSVPDGWWRYDASLYYGKTVRIVPSIPTQFMSRNDSLTLNLSGNRMLRRDQRSKLEGFAKYEWSDRKNFINDTLVQTSSRVVSSLNAGLTYTRYLNSATVVLSPSVSAGLPWLGAIGNSAGLSQTDAHAEYLLYGLYGLYRHNVRLGNSSAFTFESTFNGQYSPVGLYGERQFVLGGEYSVRGFKENVLSDDSGWSLRNELIFPVGQWTHSLHKRESVIPLNLKLFYDLGVTYSSDGSDLQTLAGWGIGLDYRYKWVQAGISRSKALDSSSLFSKDEGWITRYGLSITTVF